MLYFIMQCRLANFQTLEQTEKVFTSTADTVPLKVWGCEVHPSLSHQQVSVTRVEGTACERLKQATHTIVFYPLLFSCSALLHISLLHSKTPPDEAKANKYR